MASIKVSTEKVIRNKVKEKPREDIGKGEDSRSGRETSEPAARLMQVEAPKMPMSRLRRRGGEEADDRRTVQTVSRQSFGVVERKEVS